MRRSLLAALALLAATGCARNGAHGTGTPNALGLPPSGMVKVIPTRVRDDAKSVQWEWAVLGDRCWSSCSNSLYAPSLSKSYPLNSPTVSGGTHVWMYSLKVNEASAPGRSVEVETLLRGSIGTFSQAGGAFGRSRKASLADMIKVVQTQEAILRLPARLTLAVLDGRPIVLNITP